MPPVAKSRRQRKRSTKFDPDWAKQFGLSVSARDPGTSAILSVTCMFCTVFGRELPAEPNSSNRYIKTIKAFKPPYRTDNFRSHLRTQHPQKWGAFQHSDEGARSTFFNVEVPYAETIFAHFGKMDQAITADVDATIVENVLKGMLLTNGTDNNSLSAMFTLNPTQCNYTLEIKDAKLFKIILDQVSLGMSFRATARSLNGIRTTCGLSFLAQVSELKVSKNVQALTAVVLQRIAELLRDKRCWAFSIAFDGATNNGDSYIDVRVRFCVSGKLANVHILAIPITVSHTGANIFDAIAKLLTAEMVHLGVQYQDHDQ